MDPMPRPLYPHVMRERTCRGRMVWYFRVGKGPRTRLPDDYGSPAFMAAYHAALAGEPPPAAPGRAAKGSLAWLVARYQESSAWSRLSDATRYQRRLIFAKVIDKAGDQPFAVVTAKAVKAGREARKATPFMANNYLRAVKGLFAWAVEAEYLAENPAAAVQEIAIRTAGHEPWSIDDVRRYEARWPPQSRERVWLHVLLYTGLRLGDACAVGRPHMKDGWITLRMEKTGQVVTFPVLQPLAATLEAGQTGDLAFVANAHGRPFVKESFGNAFRDACRAAGIEGRSAHGLRKLLASMAAELGASEEQLQAWFGWMSNRMSAVYTRAASRKAMAGKLGDLFAANAAATSSARTLLSGAGIAPKTSMKSTRRK